ncbi:MAG: N-glycosylase/DNA lyase [Elusimicrobia bacterium]|nr:N-glycosylase/DNA lyase [Elusimicrobiota bacterium]
MKTIKIDYIELPKAKTLPLQNMQDLRNLWNVTKTDIEKRVKHFENIWKTACDEEIFAELSFCLFTPQSKAVSCWKAVNLVTDKGLLLNGKAAEIAGIINFVRFRNNKAKYLVEARKLFTENGKIKIKNKLKSFKNPQETREWIVKNIKGIGYKEAGHFLRNTGLGLELAILDRHILKNLIVLGVIKEMPKSLTKAIYLDIEAKMQNFCNKVKVPMAHMDLLLWARQAGGIFK